MATIANYDSHAGFYSELINTNTPPESAFMREYYRVLHAYYLTNGLYDFINKELKATKTSAHDLKPIRNPAWRIVEFYAAKLFPGKLPEALAMEVQNEKIVEPIRQLHRWSNFSSKKQKWARWFAIYGDWFIKISTRGDENKTIFMSLIRPEDVNDFKVDERGFLTWIRIDVAEVDDEENEYTYTEIWDKEKQTMTIWEHGGDVYTALDELPEPKSVSTFEQTHGEDFIPIVYQPFRDDGSGRGSSAFSAQLDKIDEANRQATRLAQILFRHNRPIWAATTTGTDASGRPLPPISLAGLANTDEEVMIGDETILALPGMSELNPLVPNLNYADALAILEATVAEIDKDLPELAYYKLKDMGDLTGRAVKILMDDMISRVIEVRGNAESALSRAHAMALSIGQNYGIWTGLGDYTSGDFVHDFVERPILPRDIYEEAQVVQLYTAAGANLLQAALAAGMSKENAEAYF